MNDQAIPAEIDQAADLDRIDPRRHPRRHPSGVSVTLRRAGYESLHVYWPTVDLDWTDPTVYNGVLPEILRLVPDAVADLVEAKGPQPKTPPPNRAQRRRRS